MPDATGARLNSFLQNLALLAAVTAAGGVAVLRASRFEPRASTPAASVVATPAWTPPTIHSPISAVAESMDILRHAPRFEAAAVGYSGSVPTSVVAWLTVVRSAAPDSLLRKLLQTATPAGQLYALAGLRVTNPELFAETARDFRTFHPTVPTLAGCIGGSELVRTIVSDLERGEWVDGFLRAERASYQGALPWPQN
ncbi:MAG TPA: hypothetical protein VJ802_07685 [Gemmatimonadaceae bacterium]|nr:hypothetical protein [Gemmatimonadaceae bacterium]